MQNENTDGEEDNDKLNMIDDMDSNFSISKQNVPQNIARSAYNEEVKGSHLGPAEEADPAQFTKPASTVQEDDAEKIK